MSKSCDNKSVGVIIKNADGKFAVIKRKNYPVAYAFVAGHLDGDTPEDAAVKEADEEVGIKVKSLEKKLEDKFQNPCKREGGSWHEWHIFEANEWSGELKAGSDAKDAHWLSSGELKTLADRTHLFLEKSGIPLEELNRITALVSDNPEWQEEPGLEPVWVVMLEKMNIF